MLGMSTFDFKFCLDTKMIFLLIIPYSKGGSICVNNLTFLALPVSLSLWWLSILKCSPNRKWSLFTFPVLFHTFEWAISCRICFPHNESPWKELSSFSFQYPDTKNEFQEHELRKVQMTLHVTRTCF